MKKSIFYNGFIINQIHNGSFRVTRNDDSDEHTHLRNLSACYKLIDNINHKKIPKRCGLYYLESHIRLANNDEYKRKLQNYYNVKVQKGRKEQYFKKNINTKKRKDL